MFCPKCGTEVPDGYAFCTMCGSAVPQAPTKVALQNERTSNVGRSRTILLVLSLVLLTWAGSAVVAYGIVELTGGGPQGEQGPRGARGPSGTASASGFSTDSTPCHVSIVEYTQLAASAIAGQISGATLDREEDEILDRIRVQC